MGTKHPKDPAAVRRGNLTWKANPRPTSEMSLRGQGRPTGRCMVYVSANLPQELHARLVAAVERRDETISGLIRTAVAELLARDEESAVPEAAAR